MINQFDRNDNCLVYLRRKTNNHQYIYHLSTLLSIPENIAISGIDTHVHKQMPANRGNNDTNNAMLAKKLGFRYFEEIM